jgi:hypothetical protein
MSVRSWAGLFSSELLKTAVVSPAVDIRNVDAY